MAELREFPEVLLMIQYAFIHSSLFYFMQHNSLTMNEFPFFSYYYIRLDEYLERLAVIVLDSLHFCYLMQ